MLTADPPDHTRLRKLVHQGVHRAADRRAAAADRGDHGVAARRDGAPGAGGRDEVDLIEAFAFPLPVTVICELLGVPAGDQEDFKSWSHAILSSTATPDECRAAGTAMYRYFTELIAAKRAAPADDLLSALIDARDSDDPLDERELMAMLFLLLVAGHETTANLIATGTLALLDEPGRARPAARRSRACCRARSRSCCATPTRSTTRPSGSRPSRPRSAGSRSRPGEWVLCVTSSANRDPGRFADPDRLDVGRDASGHVAFGHGIHYCLGAPLARLEGEIAFGALLSRFPGSRWRSTRPRCGGARARSSTAWRRCRSASG